MMPACNDTYDVLLDGTPWRLVSLAEWEYLQGMQAQRGLTWRAGDADAVRHRLLCDVDHQEEV